MRTYNMHEAKTQLSRLVALAAKGKGFIIAKAGKPLVKVVPLDSREATVPRRLGFLAGEIAVPVNAFALFNVIAFAPAEKLDIPDTAIIAD